MREDTIHISEFNFKWGDHINDIKDQLSENDISVENENQYSNDKTIKINLPKIWDIKTNSCEFRAPLDDRLINYITINISAEETNQEQIIRKLENRFGPKSDNYFGHNYDRASNSGEVVRNCTWKRDNCVIGVSIYGGVRKEHNEENIGSWYMYLQDVNILDSLYAKKIKEIELDLINKVDLKSLHSFKMKTEQQATWSMEKDKYPTLSSNYISRAMNSFHKREIFQTPSKVSELISEFEVAVWKSTTGSYYLSNYWETVALKQPLSASWINATPARGSGYCFIRIAELGISNDHSQPETKKFIEHIEKTINISIPCHNDVDC